MFSLKPSGPRSGSGRDGSYPTYLRSTSSSITRKSPFHGSSRRRRTIALFCSEDMFLLSSASRPHRATLSPGVRPKLLGRELRDTRSKRGAALALKLSGVRNRLLAAETHATGD